jgi:hypothetical protein
LKDLSDEGEQQYGDIGDLTSDKIWYRETKGIEYRLYRIIKDFHGIHRDRMVFQNPLLIIDTERSLGHVWVFPDP